MELTTLVVNSSAYFLVTDASIGPTSQTLGGGACTILKVPLWSVSCNMQVTAIIEGRQRTTGGQSEWELSSGQSPNNFGHFLLLGLPSANNVNSWVGEPSLRGCKFETHPIKPVKINCHQCHKPNAGLVIGHMVLKMEAQL